MTGARALASVVAVVCAAQLGGCTAIAERNNPSYSYRFDNGSWYADGAFRPETVYVDEGRLIFGDPGLPADEVIDITGGFVVPPYCEGHNHNFGGSADGARETSQIHLEQGVFYAMMFGSFRTYRDQIAADINKPDAVDVAFANNGLTGSGGHPKALRERLMKRFGRYPEFTPKTLADAGYFEADTLAEVREKWALIRAKSQTL